MTVVTYFGDMCENTHKNTYFIFYNRQIKKILFLFTILYYVFPFLHVTCTVQVVHCLSRENTCVRLAWAKLGEPTKLHIQWRHMFELNWMTGFLPVATLGHECKRFLTVYNCIWVYSGCRFPTRVCVFFCCFYKLHIYNFTNCQETKYINSNPHARRQLQKIKNIDRNRKTK